MHRATDIKRKESDIEVQTYLARLIHALKSDHTEIVFQKNRRVDQGRNKRYTNRFTISQLFPDEDEIVAVKRELSLLTIEDYIETVRDTRFPKKSEMRTFGKQYSGEDVYIKIRVELLRVSHASGSSSVLVMSFHYAERKFIDSDFPYKND